MTERITGTLSNTTGSISGNLSETSRQISGSLARLGSHPDLTGRGLPNQHPIDSIESLEAELAYRPSEAMSNLDIQAILDS